MRSRTNLLLLLGLALVAGCSRCGRLGESKAELLSLLPRDAGTVVVVPDLSVIGDRLQILQKLKVLNLLAQMQNAGSAGAWLNSAIAQLGIDVRSPEALKEAGLDPVRGAAVVVGSDRVYSVVAVGDPSKFDASVARLARDRLGAGQKATRKSGAHTITTFSREAGGSPWLGYVLRDGYAFVAANAHVAQLGLYASLPEESSLNKDGAFKESLARLPKERDAIIRFGDVSASVVPWASGSTVVVRLTQEHLSLTSDTPRPGGAPGYLEKKTAPNLLPYLPENAFLVARFQGDPAALDSVWPSIVGPNVERAVRESGFDLKAELLDNLRPGGAIGVGMANEPTLDLSRLQAALGSFDVRRTNPFRLLHLVAVSEVKDPAKAAATLEKLPAVAQRFGARVEGRDRDGKKLYVTEYSQGEGTHFALVGNEVVLAAPLQKLEETLAALEKPVVGSKGPVAAFPALASALDEHAFGVVLNIPQLADSIRNLPTHAWGLGGALIRESSLRIIDAVSDLRAITYTAWAKDNAVQTELTLRYEKK